MIWHIFRKDVRLTWHLAALAAGLHWTGAAVIMMMLNGFPDLGGFGTLLVLFGLAVTGFVIMAAVQHDAIPGVRQDWLVRPIRRRDLLLAKLLFVAVMIQLPIFMGDVAGVLISGFSLLPALNAAFQHSVVQMLAINLPFLALASITRNLLEVMSGAVAIGLVLGIGVGLPPITWEPVLRTPLSWIPVSAQFTVLVLGATLVLALQYFGRRTFVSRALIGAVVLMGISLQFLPWRSAFAVQTLLASTPGASRDIALNFDPSAGKFQPPQGVITQNDAIAFFKNNDAVRLYLPFNIAGLQPDSTVLADHSEVRLIDTNGRVEPLQLAKWNIRRESSHPEKDVVYPELEISGALYKRIKDQPVRLEVDHWLTVVRLAASHALPAIGGEQPIPGVGRCGTKVNDNETAVTVSCMEAGVSPRCVAFFLEHVPSGQHNPARFACQSYAQLIMNPIFPISVEPFGSNLPFRSSSGLATFPLNASMLRESRAVIQVYRVQDHFMRTVVIPEVRLGEWEAERPSS